MSTGERDLRLVGMPGRASRSAVIACGIAAAALVVALIGCTAAHLPLGLHRYDGPTLGLVLGAALAALVWPELALPLVIIGAGLIDARFGGERVRHLVFVKLALFACAGIGIALSRLRQRSRFERVRTPADAPALCLLGYTALSAACGYLIAGHDLDSVAVAGYHLGQLALYHYLVTITLNRPESFRRAGAIVIAWSLIWVAPSLLMCGRGGGTASRWLLVLICYAAAGGARWAPLAWGALPLALLDTLTSGYRTLWLGLAGQMTWLAGASRPARLRWLRVVAVALLVVCVFGAALAVSRPSLLAPLPAAETLQRFAASIAYGGYRLPEALVGVAAFRESPVFGRWVGYQTPPVWLDTMGYMRVGPIHHVYYVSYLANEGLIGLGLALWYFAAVLFSGRARRMRRQASQDQWCAAGVGLQAALFGAILGAFLSGPGDGHWTWGVFGAGALLPAMWATRHAGAREWGPVRGPVGNDARRREETLRPIGAFRDRV